jgi:hypothetical protein
MALPKVENRGQPFKLRPDMKIERGSPVDDPASFVVSTPGFEDWDDVIVVKKSRGWRCYSRETITGYDTSFGRGGMTVHDRLHAIRSASTGRPLGTFATADAARTALEAAFNDGDVLPA